MDKVSFKERVAIVTGAGGGIGRTYALELARRGASVVVNDLGGDIKGLGSSCSMADQVVAEIIDLGGVAVANYDSVSDPENAGRIVAQALDRFGKVDILINNAGIMRNGAIENSVVQSLHAEIETHLYGTIFMTRAVWPHLRSNGYGRIVFTGSDTGMYGNATQLGYAAAKAGVFGVMNVAALEGEAHGILCNAIMPNALGRMTDAMLLSMDEAAVAAATENAALLGDAMNPEFNTALAVFLASETCTITHRAFSSCLGRFAEIVVGTTHGWQGPRDRPATVEEVVEHLAPIQDVTGGLNRFTDPQDQLARLLQTDLTFEKVSGT